MDIAKQVDYFKGLAYDIQKAKVTEMLYQLEGTHETFAMFYKAISTLDTISEEILLYLYQGILEIAEDIEAGRKDDAQKKIKKMGEVLMMIKEQEEREKIREGDPEELLKSI